MSYSFGNFELDEQTYQLRQSKEIVAIEPQAFKVLAYLMGQKEELSEQIKYLTELLKLTWLSLLGIGGGGTISLVLGEPTLYRQIAAGAGMTVGVVLVITLGYLHRRIRAEISKMREV